MVTAISLLICLAASALGAICGIGGGVIIKPVLDSLGIYSVSTVNFLSGCTVLSMSGYTVLKGLRDTDSSVDWGRTSFLAVGAALGGLLGKELFSRISELFAASETVGAIQAVCLFIITLGTLLYTLNKQRIPTRDLHGRMVCILIGFFLGGVLLVSGDWRRPYQSGGSFLFLLHGHENRCPELPVHHPDLPDQQPAADGALRKRPALLSAHAARHGRVRRAGRDCRALCQPADSLRHGGPAFYWNDGPDPGDLCL